MSAGRWRFIGTAPQTYITPDGPTVVAVPGDVFEDLPFDPTAVDAAHWQNAASEVATAAEESA